MKGLSTFQTFHSLVASPFLSGDRHPNGRLPRESPFAVSLAQKPSQPSQKSRDRRFARRSAVGVELGLGNSEVGACVTCEYVLKSGGEGERESRKFADRSSNGNDFGLVLISLPNCHVIVIFPPCKRQKYSPIEKTTTVVRKKVSKNHPRSKCRQIYSFNPTFT